MNQFDKLLIQDVKYSDNINVEKMKEIYYKRDKMMFSILPVLADHFSCKNNYAICTQIHCRIQ